MFLLGMFLRPQSKPPGLAHTPRGEPTRALSLSLSVLSGCSEAPSGASLCLCTLAGRLEAEISPTLLFPFREERFWRDAQNYPLGHVHFFLLPS